MNKVLKHRIKLIKAMLEAKKSFSSYNTKLIFSNYINSIRKDTIHFLSLSEDDYSKVSFAKTAVEKFNTELRVKTTLQRYFRRQLGVSVDIISDSQLDKFCNLVALFTDESLDTKIKLFSGKQISEFYSDTVIKSCMTGACSSFKTSLYSLNPSRVKLAIFSNEVRALLWLCDDGKYVLDRCYPAGHWGVGFLRAWARKRGYLLRNAADFVTDETNNKISDNKDHTVTLRHEGLFPYMDTFKYAIIGAGTVIASNNPSFGATVLSNTDGSFYKREVCTKCGNIIDPDSDNPYMSNGDGNNYLICGKCYKKYAFACSLCRKNLNLSLRYEDWDICEKCHSFMKGYMIYNKCSCFKCSDLKRHYSEIIKCEVIKENSKKNIQMCFDFDK